MTINNYKLITTKLGGNMETRIINKTIEHVGDLRIEGDVKEKNQINVREGSLVILGDVEEKTQINVREGSLVILGNVKNGAEINISISEKFKNSFSAIWEAVLGPGVPPPKLKVDSVERPYGNCLVGNLSVFDGLIRTDDKLIILNEDAREYKIIPDSERQAFDESRKIRERYLSGRGVPLTNERVQSVEGLATAIIDGKQYQGNVISIKRGKILVDGEESGNFPLEKTLQVPTLQIHGNVGQDVIIKSDASIEVLGEIGNSSKLKSKHAGLVAKDIGMVLIKVSDEINVHNVGEGSALTSLHKGITGNKIGDNVLIQAYGAIKVESVGNDCKVKSDQGSITVDRNVGNNAKVKCYEAIYIGGTTGEDSKLIRRNKSVAGNSKQNAGKRSTYTSGVTKFVPPLAVPSEPTKIDRLVVNSFFKN